jgi:hypothetical protein
MLRNRSAAPDCIWGSMSRVSEYITSSAVTSRPSWNLMLRRSVNVQVSPPREAFQKWARQLLGTASAGPAGTSLDSAVVVVTYASTAKTGASSMAIPGTPPPPAPHLEPATRRAPRSQDGEAHLQRVSVETQDPRGRGEVPLGERSIHRGQDGSVARGPRAGGEVGDSPGRPAGGGPSAHAPAVRSNRGMPIEDVRQAFPDGSFPTGRRPPRSRSWRPSTARSPADRPRSP